jgi:hypothetical protein
MNNGNVNISSDGSENSAEKNNRLQALNDSLSFSDDDLFEKEAAEGLSQLEEQKVPQIVDKLNADLHRQLKKKKKRKGIADNSHTYITIITILLLVVVAFIVLKKIL